MTCVLTIFDGVVLETMRGHGVRRWVNANPEFDMILFFENIYTDEDVFESTIALYRSKYT